MRNSHNNNKRVGGGKGYYVSYNHTQHLANTVCIC